jgi:hypothetical protein
VGAGVAAAVAGDAQRVVIFGQARGASLAR